MQLKKISIFSFSICQMVWEDENRNQVIETLKYHLNEVFAHIFPIFGGNGGLCKALTRAPSSGNATNQIQQAHKLYQPNSNSRHPLTIDHFIPLIQLFMRPIVQCFHKQPYFVASMRHTLFLGFTSRWRISHGWKSKAIAKSNDKGFADTSWKGDLNVYLQLQD